MTSHLLTVPQICTAASLPLLQEPPVDEDTSLTLHEQQNKTASVKTTPSLQVRTWNGQLCQRDVPQHLRQFGHPVRAAGRQHVSSAANRIPKVNRIQPPRQLCHAIDVAAAFRIKVLVVLTAEVEFRLVPGSFAQLWLINSASRGLPFRRKRKLRLWEFAQKTYTIR